MQPIYNPNSCFGFHQTTPSSAIIPPPPHIPSSSLAVNHSPPPSTLIPNLQYNHTPPSPVLINLKQSAETIMMDSIKLNQYENTIYLNQLSYSKDLEIHRRKISSDLEQIKLLHGEVTRLKAQMKTLNEKRKEYLKSLYGNHSLIDEEEEDEEDELDIETLLMEYEYNANNDNYTPHHLPKSISLTNNNTLLHINSASTGGGATLGVSHHGANNINLNNTNHTRKNHHSNINSALVPPNIGTSAGISIEQTNLNQQVQQPSIISISNNDFNNPPPPNTNTDQQTGISINHQQQQPPPLHLNDDTESNSSVLTTTSTNYSNNFRINKDNSKTKSITNTNTSKNNHYLNESRSDIDDVTSTTPSRLTSSKSKNKTNIIVESKKRKEIVDLDDSDDEDSKFSLFKSPKKPKLKDKSSKDMLRLIKRQEIEKQKKLHLMNRFDEDEYIANNSTTLRSNEPKLEIEPSPPKSKPITDEEVIKSPTIHQQVVNLVEEENPENSIGDDILYYSLLSGCVKKDENREFTNNTTAEKKKQDGSSTNNKLTGSPNHEKAKPSTISDSSSEEEDNYGKYFKPTKKKKKSKNPGIECEECREFYEACFPNDEEKRNRVIRECSRHRNGHHHHTSSVQKSPSLNYSPIIGVQPPSSNTNSTANPNQSSSVTKQPSVNFESVPGTPPEYWDLGSGPTDTYRETNEDETQLSKSY